MLVPESTYRHRYSRPWALEPFWEGEAPIPMRGSRRVRRWLHDRRYSVRDGYLFDLRDRYLQRFKPTAISSKGAAALWNGLNQRITALWQEQGRSFSKYLDPGYGIADGKVVLVDEGALLLADLADELEAA